MTLDEMIEELRIHGDKFKSVIATASGFQANAESRYGSNSYATAQGATLTESVTALWKQRCGTMAPAPTSNLDDII